MDTIMEDQCFEVTLGGQTRRIRMELLTSDHVKQATDVLTVAFARSDPLTTHLGYPENDWAEFGETYCRKAAAERLSHVAVDDEKGEVVAVVVAEDAKAEQPDLSQLRNPLWKTVVEILERIEQVWCLDKVGKGEVLHHFLLGTHPDYCKGGIMGRLQRLNLMYARELGYQKVVTEATGKYSQRSYEKLGFVTDTEIPYDGSYTTKSGETPFKDYKLYEHPSCKGLSLDL
eukprot:gb/GECG01016338.1/.p1 GENE.gb/GECG01016338.1/~~gb/GECG01016338.1/.p1  ORF type:complete len:230 (+),score=27.11 gb/GECG01016338.1/:1-690(+)